jgi:hypothetical protein
MLISSPKDIGRASQWLPHWLLFDSRLAKSPNSRRLSVRIDSQNLTAKYQGARDFCNRSTSFTRLTASFSEIFGHCFRERALVLFESRDRSRFPLRRLLSFTMRH